MSMRQIALDIGLEAPPSFENFEAAGNEAAVEAVQAWVHAVGQPHRSMAPVLYLWGEEGAGKSHLLRAAAQALLRRTCRFGWMGAVTPGAPTPVDADMEFAADWDAIILDDVDLYEAEQQHQAFNWFVNAFTPQTGNVRPVLAAGLLPPTDLKLRDDLRSRLAWGDIYPVQVLGEASARQVLQRRAKAKGLTLNEDVLRYVLTRFSRDTGSLMQLLEHLDRYALQTQRAITVPMLKAMFNDV